MPGPICAARFRQQRRRPAQHDARAQPGQQQRVRARHPAVKDVAGRSVTVTPSSVFGDPHCVPGFFRRCRIVRRSSSACEGCSCMPSPAFSTGSPVARSSRYGAPEYGVAQDDALGARARAASGRCPSGSRLFRCWRRGADQRGIRAQALGRQLEGGARARARFVEQQRDPALRTGAAPAAPEAPFSSKAAASECAAISESERLAGGKQRPGCAAELEMAGADVPGGLRHGCHRGFSVTEHRAGSSSLRNGVCLVNALHQQHLLVVVHFPELHFHDFARPWSALMRPTKVASIGSSRCPRSISVRSCTRRGRPWSKSASSAARMVRPV